MQCADDSGTRLHTSGPLKVRAEVERWPLRTPFRITGYTWYFIEVLTVRIELNGVQGRGEAAGVYYRNDRPAGMLEKLERLLPTLVEARIELIEQPLPIGEEAQLEGFRSPIPIAADESVQSLKDLPALVGRFDVVNIKLDKCGGLTEGLAMARAARELGLAPMVGNMLGTSLAMAPAFLLGQLCHIVDLDGPIFLTTDRAVTVDYRDGLISCPSEIWG